MIGSHEWSGRRQCPADLDREGYAECENYVLRKSRRCRAYPERCDGQHPAHGPAWRQVPRNTPRDAIKASAGRWELLVGQAETDFSGITAGASATIENLNNAIREIQHILASFSQGQGTASKLLTDPGLYDRSQRVIEKLEVASDKSIALLDKVDRGEGTIGRLVTDKEIYDRASQAAKALAGLTRRPNNRDGTLVKLTDPALYQRLDALTARGEQLLTKVETGEGTLGKLVTRDELYTRADKLLTDVEALVDDVKKNPAKYFKLSVF